MAVITILGGSTSNFSFVIFSLEYYKAAFTISMTKEGKPQAAVQKFHSQVRLIEKIFIGNFLISWILITLFVVEDAYRNHSVPQGHLTEDINAQICVYTNSIGMYLTAGFLLKALF